MTSRVCGSRLILVLLIVAAWGPAHVGWTAPKEILTEADKGKIEFKTLTLSRDELLAGAKTGKEAVIFGELEFPKGTDSVPAIVIFHGGGGISRAEYDWARELRSVGVATFVVDSYTGRGIRNLSGGLPLTHELTPTGQTLDVYRALTVMATHPRIDPQRLGVMGRSRGGVIAVVSGLENMRKAQRPPTIDVVAYLAVFPAFPPGGDFASWEIVHGRPIRIFQGAADDITPVATARAFVEAQRAKGVDVKLFEYPGAPHAFDDADLRDPVQYRTATGAVRTLGGYSGAAVRQAVKDVTGSLREIFGLK